MQVDEKKLGELKVVLKKMAERKFDVNAKMHQEIEENGKFDAEDFFKRLCEAASYDGPERRKRA